MTLERIHGRNDYWHCHYKHNGKLYSTFASSLSKVIEQMFQELEITKQQCGHWHTPEYICADNIPF